jgi:hypothetical protein
VVVSDGKGVFGNLSDDDLDRVAASVELACFAGLARREYFTQLGAYCNADCFQLHIQKLGPDPGAVSFRTRRRDGSTTAGWSLDRVAISIPVHVSPVTDVRIDRSLLTALATHQTAARLAEKSRLQSAISCYNHANTDNPVYPYQVEWVLLASAFEQLLGARSSAADVARLFDETLLPHEPISASAARRALATWEARCHSLRYEWMHEFYRLRGDYAHGKMRTRQLMVWRPEEHLLLASIAFPLVVRSVLARSGAYELTEDDLAQIDAFEKLADVNSMKPRGGRAHERWWWPKLVWDAKWEVLARGIADAGSRSPELASD